MRGFFARKAEAPSASKTPTNSEATEIAATAIHETGT
jgi:hypothetical protein